MAKCEFTSGNAIFDGVFGHYQQPRKSLGYLFSDKIKAWVLNSFILEEKHRFYFEENSITPIRSICEIQKLTEKEVVIYFEEKK